MTTDMSTILIETRKSSLKSVTYLIETITNMQRRWETTL
jgi:hypothetical protein